MRVPLQSTSNLLRHETNLSPRPLSSCFARHGASNCERSKVQLVVSLHHTQLKHTLFNGSRLCSGLKKRRPCSGRTVVTRAVYQPFPFDEENYYRATLQLVQAADQHGRPEGNLVFMKEGETVYEKDKKALVLSVGGDTLSGIASQIQRRESERPLALDLLWQILGRGAEISNRDWRLIRVAIVELKNNVYYGRLFFGDSENGKVVWDCDCRPSDACWLSLKANCGIYIRKEVWDAHAVFLSDLMGGEESAAVTAGGYGQKLQTEEDDTGTALLTKIRKNDPDPIKRLKREMEVALQEEDYATAARIRDHPFMQLHVKVVKAQKEGNLQEAQVFAEQLEKAIQDSEQSRGMS